MNKVLVTGANGFLGRHTARVFAEKNWLVMGLGLGDWNERGWKTWGLNKWHCAKVDLEALMNHAGDPDVIIHCAGSADVSFSMKHPRRDFRNSVNTTLDVLEYARLMTPPATVVFPSSAAVYGGVWELPIKEEQPLCPISPYGHHKKICEELIGSYAQHFSVPASVVRFFSIYGNGLRKQIFWDACHRFSNGEAKFFGSGRETRDFLHVSDAARLLYTAAIKANTGCPIVNGGSGVQTDIEWVLNEVCRSLPGAPHPVFTGNIREGDPQHYQADTSRARAWGWIPRRNLDDGIAEYVRWFLDTTSEKP